MTAAEQPARYYTTSEVLALTGAKFRFVDYAIRVGYLPNDTATGSGHWRRFTEAEVDTIHAAAHLVRAGITPEVAFDIAHALTESGEYRRTVGSIYEITVTVRDTAPDPTPEEATP